MLGLIRNHPFDFRRIRIAYQNRLSEFLFSFVRLRGQDVTQVRMPALHLPSRSLLEALGSAFVGF